MNRRCDTCKYFHKLKEFDPETKGWKHGTVCTYFPQTEKGFDAFALVVKGDDLCECYKEEIR